MSNKNSNAVALANIKSGGSRHWCINRQPLLQTAVQGPKNHRANICNQQGEPTTELWPLKICVTTSFSLLVIKVQGNEKKKNPKIKLIFSMLTENIKNILKCLISLEEAYPE